MSKKVFCIIGRTCSGKSSISKAVADDLGLQILKSYTTRPMRNNETVENSDHTFISSDDVEKYKNEMVAYTERVNYCSFATQTQLFENDIYIINPSGFIDLKKSTKNIDIELIDIWIECPKSILKRRAILRGTWETWLANSEKEEEEFETYPCVKTHVVSNRNEPLTNAINRVKNIIRKELER